MKPSVTIGGCGIGLLLVAVALDIIEQMESQNGFHFRLLHAATFLILMGYVQMWEKPN
jgi:hypothetical protein